MKGGRDLGENRGGKRGSGSWWWGGDGGLLTPLVRGDGAGARRAKVVIEAGDTEEVDIFKITPPLKANYTHREAPKPGGVSRV